VSVQCMRLLNTVDVPWPSALYPEPNVRAGTLVGIDMTNTAMVAAYGGAGNLEPVTADLGSPDTLDKSWLHN
jgi:hypothetical protein